MKFHVKFKRFRPGHKRGVFLQAALRRKSTPFFFAPHLPRALEIAEIKNRDSHGTEYHSWMQSSPELSKVPWRPQ